MCLKQYDSSTQQILMLVIVTDKILLNIGIISNVKRVFGSNFGKKKC